MKKHGSSIILIFIFLLGLSVLLYPSISNYWNSFHQSQSIVDYNTIFQSMDREDYTEEFSSADRYNHDLRKITYPLMNCKKLDGYEDILNVSGTGIMGYIEIEKIGVELPIYHGTSESVLNIAVGHIEGTSLPTGGPGTHPAFSAHRGLPSAKLFTNLDELVPGDTFVVTVLDRVMTYEVDQILIVKPDEVDALAVTDGKDYCTLVTCTPYGINSHRLLVRGTRVENADRHVVRVTPDAVRVSPLLVAPLAAIPILLLLLLYLLLRQKKHSGGME